MHDVQRDSGAGACAAGPARARCRRRRRRCGRARPASAAARASASRAIRAAFFGERSETSISDRPPSGSVTPSPSVPPRDIDQFERAAAEVADDAVRLVDRGGDAERGRAAPPRRPTATGSARRSPARLARRNCGPLAASRTAAVASARTSRIPMMSQSTRNRRSAASARSTPSSGKHARRRDAAAEAAQHLLVEDRRRRARQRLVGDEPHRIRADVDDGHRLARRRRARSVMVSLSRCAQRSAVARALPPRTDR